MMVTVTLFPHAGGMAHQYAPLSGRLREMCGRYGVELDIHVVDYRAGGRARDVQQIACECAQDLPAAPGRVLLVGHSLGAFVAYETALLAARTSTAYSLVVSGQVAPRLHRNGRIHLAPDETLVRELVRVDARNREIFADAQLRSAFLPLIRDDYRLVETYTPTRSATLLERIVAVRGDQDAELSTDAMIPWRDHARQWCGPVIVPGSHMHHLDPQGQLAEILTGEVTQCLTGPALKTP